MCALSVVALIACSERKPPIKPLTDGVPPGTVATAAPPEEPLPPEMAFPLKVEPIDAKTLVAQFTPAPEHYLYKSKITFTLKDSSGMALAPVTMPPGMPKKDPFLGDQEVYRQPTQITVPLLREAGRPARFTLVTSYQGCNERIGLCYSPIETASEFLLPQ